MYKNRNLYRSLFNGDNMTYFNVCVKETDLCIASKQSLYDEAFQLVKKLREQLESYISKNSLFLTSLQPISALAGAPTIVKKMCEATQKANVGPMASVAGAVSELVGYHLLKFSDEVIVENGGDIFIKTTTPRKIGIFAGNSPLSFKMALRINPNKTPRGICTSAGTIGPSLSFGKADAAMIIANDTFLSDAVATAAGNLVKTPDDLEKAVNYAASIAGVCGAVIIMGEKLAVWGDVELVRF